MSLKETFDKKRVAGRLLGSPILLVIACALLGIGAKKITGSVRKEGEGK